MSSSSDENFLFEKLTSREQILAYAEETLAETEGWEGELVTADAVCNRFEIATAKLEQLIAARQVVAFEGTAKVLHFPVEQFELGGVIPGLHRLREIVPVQMELWRWLVTPWFAFDERRPLDAIRAGRLDDVIEAAHWQYDQ